MPTENYDRDLAQELEACRERDRLYPMMPADFWPEKMTITMEHQGGSLTVVYDHKPDVDVLDTLRKMAFHAVAERWRQTTPDIRERVRVLSDHLRAGVANRAKGNKLPT